MSVAQHLQTVESFHKFMFFRIIFQYFSFSRLFHESKPSKKSMTSTSKEKTIKVAVSLNSFGLNLKSVPGKTRNHAHTLAR